MTYELDDKLARAAATDTANTHMHSEGRSTWNREDLNIAASTYNHLLLRAEKEKTGRLGIYRSGHPDDKLNG